jgi:hypothetical protein
MRTIVAYDANCTLVGSIPGALLLKNRHTDHLKYLTSIVRHPVAVGFTANV